MALGDDRRGGDSPREQWDVPDGLVEGLLPSDLGLLNIMRLSGEEGA